MNREITWIPRILQEEIKISGIVKGTTFEVELAINLHSLDDVRVIPNLGVFSPYLGRDTEIDLLVLSPWGIYCLEAKSFNTGLMGSLEDDFWAGVTGRKVTRIYNPVMQNFEHIRCLKRRVKEVTGKFIDVDNYVVVPDSCKISTDVRHMVLNLTELMDKLVSDSFNRPRFSFNEVAASFERR